MGTTRSGPKPRPASDDSHRSAGGTYKFDPNRFAQLTGVIEACVRKTPQPIREIVAEGLVVHGTVPAAEHEARILAALTAVRLSPAAEIADRFPHTMSGGLDDDPDWPPSTPPGGPSVRVRRSKVLTTTTPAGAPAISP